MLPQDKIKTVLKTKRPLALKTEYERRFVYLPILALGYVFNDFNMANPEIGYNPNPKRNERNKALRRAIRKAYNWEEQIDGFYLGIGEAFPDVLIPGLEGYDADASKVPVTHDPEGAKRLLKAYGWDKETLPVLEYNSVSNPRSRKHFEAFRHGLTLIGYPSEKIHHITYNSFGDFDSAVNNRKCMFYKMTWYLAYPDPQNIFQNYYGPFKSSGINGSNFHNDSYDRLYDKAMVMMPGAARGKIYKQMNDILLEEVPTISGFSPANIHLWHKNVIMFYRELPLANVYKYVDVLN